MKKLYFLIILLCIPVVGLFAQNRVISGQVTDSGGETLAGVSVVIVGTTTGVVTNVDGEFTIQVNSDSDQLAFSFVGFKTQTVTVGARTQINISLEDDVTELGEVVINALGFEQSVDQMGATFSEVNTEAMKRSGEANFANALSSKAAGIQINRVNGDPGAGTSIKIRGANTISGDGSPLIILDGIPISNSTLYTPGNSDSGAGGTSGGTSQQSRLNDINPNDIESVQVLKGASAAALWGSRAANGVIVITTKNGKAGKVNINYSGTYSMDWVQERIAMQDTYGQGQNGNYSPTASESWGDYIPDRAGGDDIVNTSGQYFLSESGNLYYPITTRNSTDTYVDENWDAVFQQGNFKQHDLSISGGNDKATHFFSIGNLGQDGIIKESYYDRTNLRLNSRFFLNDWLSINTKASYTNSSTNRIQQSSNVTGLLLGLLRTPPDFDTRDYKGSYFSNSGLEFTGRHRSYRRYLGGSSSNPTYNNPLWTVFEQKATSDVNRYTMSGEINISPIDKLDITLRGGTDSYTDQQVYFFPVGSASSRNNGIFAQDNVTEQEYNFDAIARSRFDISDDIKLNATLGWNINDRSREILSGLIDGFLVNTTKQTTAVNSSNDASTFKRSHRFIRSNRGYMLLDFNISNSLFVNLSGTQEAASTISDVFFYPAMDIAYQLTENVDLSSAKINFLKLRTSYGQVGVQPAPHRFQTLAEGGFSYSSYSDPLDLSYFGGGYRIDDDLGNMQLRPEIKTEWEIGVDIRALEEKLSLSATYYSNHIDDILLGIDLTPSFGFDTQYSNAASMENKGVELEVNYEIYRTADWNISAFANYSKNRNLVTDLVGVANIDLSGQSVSSRVVEGYPFGVLFGTSTLKNPDGSYDLDANGFPQLTSSPEIIGDPNPDWRANLGLNVNYKGFAFNAILDHSQGGDFSPRSIFVLHGFGTTAETGNTFVTTKDLVNYAGDVIPSGTTVRGNIGNFGEGDVLLDESWYRNGPGGGFGDSKAYDTQIADATWTRLRELSLSYTINSTAFRSRTKLNSVTLSTTARNLFMIDNIVGVDAEVNQTGVGNGAGLEYFTNPSTKSLVFSINITY